MVLIAVEELIDANPWHGLRFGNLMPVEDAEIVRYPVAGSLYDVAISSNSLEVQRDGKLLFSANSPVEIRHVTYQGNNVNGEIRAGRETELRVGASGPMRIPPGTSQFKGIL